MGKIDIPPTPQKNIYNVLFGTKGPPTHPVDFKKFEIWDKKVNF